VLTIAILASSAAVGLGIRESTSKLLSLLVVAKLSHATDAFAGASRTCSFPPESTVRIAGSRFGVFVNARVANMALQIGKF
jgi:hypothetical protein